jgi:SAM-dependent methyltransferase
MLGSSDWARQQRIFWDSCASAYADLYVDRWSVFEDDEVVELLRLLGPQTHAVVDVGCGQGLGLSLLRSITGFECLNYIGIDLSPEMLSRVKANNSGSLMLVQADMMALPVRDSSVSAVISISSSLSYSYNLEAALGEISRVLLPGGRYVVMCLSRWSLRRLAKFQLGYFGRYGTRGYRSEGGVQSAQVHFESSRSLTSGLEHNGLKVELLVGQSVFRWHGGGVGAAWWASQLLGRLLPDLGHSLISVGSKVS